MKNDDVGVRLLFLKKNRLYGPTDDPYATHTVCDQLNKQGVPYRVCCAIKHLIAWGKTKDHEELNSALGYIELEQH